MDRTGDSPFIVMKLNGYDESMRGWGFDDWDLIDRAKASGMTVHVFPEHFIKFIAHSHEERGQRLEEGFREIITEGNYNRNIQEANQRNGIIVVNKDQPWGLARLDPLRLTKSIG
jgi:predicted glycosyltransferase involved in capsule biosynthesis